MNKKYLFVFMAFIGTGCGFDKSKIVGNVIYPLSDEDEKALEASKIKLSSKMKELTEEQRGKVYDLATKRWLSGNLELYSKQICHVVAIEKDGRDKQKCEEAREKCINEIDLTKEKSKIKNEKEDDKEKQMKILEFSDLDVLSYLKKVEVESEVVSCMVSNTDCGVELDLKTVVDECKTGLGEK